MKQQKGTNLEVWEDSLVREMKKGSSVAFERCYLLLSPLIYTTIFKICGERQSAQELLQDTFLDVYQNINTYQYEQSFKAWVKKIAFNNTINYLKRANKVIFDDELVDKQYENNLSLQLDADIEQEDLLTKVLDRVSTNERVVLWLFVVEQYSHEEIAQMLGKSKSYSKSIVARALKRIRISKEVKTNVLYK